MKNHMKLINSIALLLCWVVNPLWAQQVVPEVRQAVSFDLHETLQAESRTYLATETLTADNTIEADANVVYEADKKVVMAVGFHAKGGSYFRASPRRSEAEQKLGYEANQAAVGQALVYPNPNQGQFSVRIASSAAPTQVAVYDLKGHLVWSEEVQQISEVAVDLRNQPKGVYLVKIVQGERLVTRKLIYE